MSDSKATTIEIYFDVVSPYSWLGFEQLTRYKKPWNLNVVFKPFYRESAVLCAPMAYVPWSSAVGGVMQAAQNRPPATVPAKVHCLPALLAVLASATGCVSGARRVAAGQAL